MEPFLYYLLRVSIITMLFYGLYKLFFDKTTFHTINRYLLLSILFLSVILPMFHFNLLQNLIKPASETFTLDLTNVYTISQIDDRQTKILFPWIQFLSYILFLGVLFSLLRYISGLNQIRKIISSSEKHSLTGNIFLCITDKEIAPFSWMNYIVISRKDYNADISGAIIHHEKAHIFKGHSADMILFDLFTHLFWFNPFSWLLRREILSVHEYQADEEVLNNGIDAKQYQLLLIRKSVGEYKFALANNFRKRDLHKRITMMMKTKTNNRVKWAYTAALPVLLLSMISLSVPKLNAQIIKEDPKESIIVVGVRSPEKTDTIVDALTKIEKDGETRIQLRGVGDNQPLYILDGKRMSNDEFNEINPNDIYSISVLKNESGFELYGEEGQNGVILITTKSNHDKSADERDQFIEKIMNKPLVVVDGKKMPYGFDINIINPVEIESINVLKGESAVNAYGDEGKNGVIIIKTLSD
ncbi:MAG: TonB-dependent receptor plug domain-containing protein [Fermentimonas sp.]|nr:TonB-dependent receptor plug domain-containing protein [Fermentimonas sp.]